MAFLTTMLMSLLAFLVFLRMGKRLQRITYVPTVDTNSETSLLVVPQEVSEEATSDPIGQVMALMDMDHVKSVMNAMFLPHKEKDVVELGGVLIIAVPMIFSALLASCCSLCSKMWTSPPSPDSSEDTPPAFYSCEARPSADASLSLKTPRGSQDHDGLEDSQLPDDALRSQRRISDVVFPAINRAMDRDSDVGVPCIFTPVEEERSRSMLSIISGRSSRHTTAEEVRVLKTSSVPLPRSPSRSIYCASSSRADLGRPRTAKSSPQTLDVNQRKSDAIPESALTMPSNSTVYMSFPIQLSNSSDDTIQPDESAYEDATQNMVDPGFGDPGVNLVYGYAQPHENDSESVLESHWSTFDAPIPAGPPSSVDDLRNASKRTSHEIFGSLLEVCERNTHITFDVLLHELGLDGCMKLKEGRHSEVFRISGGRGMGVIKIIHTDYIIRQHDAVINEVLIGRELNNLAKFSKNHTCGFVELKGVYCVWDKYPDELVNACTVYESRKAYSVFNESIRDISRPYVVLHMPYAGQPLSKVQFDSVLELKAVMEQVSMTLAVSEAACSFEHRCLTSDHILIKANTERQEEFILQGRGVLIENYGIRASIIDFSTSRIETDTADVVIASNFARDLSERTKPEEVELLYRLQELIEPGWTAFCPQTNVFFLHYLLIQLIEHHREPLRHNRNGSDDGVWQELECWVSCLETCGSVTDFVRAVVLPEL
ncbi:uncharacterized protein LOC135397599 isoform X2 [Ornithodoros turicata]|uniref:uncharacterized protein LOC135397599 isoform X2 n=1 Tax=Ornithodoros turicata TaxID=34597 RepID=UPI00313930CC